MRRVVIVDYKAAWPPEYLQIAQRLKRAGSENVLRIDHIGSTAVPGLAAKDVIDVQVTVRDLDDSEHLQAFKAQGFRHAEQNVADVLVGVDEDSPELRKQFFREPVEAPRSRPCARSRAYESALRTIVSRLPTRQSNGLCFVPNH